jgi:hypothetical protein
MPIPEHMRDEVTRPYVLCDIQSRNLDALACFATGVALATTFANNLASHVDVMHKITESVCPKCRAPYVMAMLRASVQMQDPSP